MNLRAIRVLCAMEFRQILRDRVRLAMMAILIALPVASLVLVGTIVWNIEPTSDEIVRHDLGNADFAVEGVESFAQLQDLLATLGEEYVTQPAHRGQGELSVEGRLISVHELALVASGKFDLGIGQGIVELQSGSYPRNFGEVAISSALAKETSLEQGDVISLEYGAPRSIVGIISNPEDTSSLQIVRAPSFVEKGGRQSLLAKSNSGDIGETVQNLRERGFKVTTAEELRLESDSFSVGVVFVSSWIGFFEASLIIGAAHAISLKRRQREFGLISSVGGQANQIFVSILLSTILIALMASLTAVLIGLATAWLIHPFLDTWTNRLNGPFEFSLAFLVGAVLLGVLASALAISLPTWRSSRLTVSEALLGYRPEGRPSNKIHSIGYALIACSIAILCFRGYAEILMGPFRLLMAPILFMSGAALISPSLISCGYLLGQSGSIMMRIAIRESYRYRSRSAIAVISVFSAISISVAASVVTSSIQNTIDQLPKKIRDDQILVSGPSAQQVATRLRTRRDVVASAPLFAAYTQGEPLRIRNERYSPKKGFQEWVALGDAELLRAFAVEEGMAEFQSGALLSVDNSKNRTAPALTSWISGRKIEVPHYASVATAQTIAGPLHFLDIQSTLSEQLQSGPPPNRASVPWVVRFTHPVDGSTLREVQTTSESSLGTSFESTRTIFPTLRYTSLIALLISVVMGMVVVISTLALNFTESKAEFKTLVSIGTGQSQLRALVGMRAWYLTMIGCALAIPGGIIVADSILSATNFDVFWTIPWKEIGLLFFVTPLIIAIGATICLHPWNNPSIKQDWVNR